MSEIFVLYTSFYKALSYLTDEQLGRLLRAIFRYNLHEDVAVADDIRIAYEFIISHLEVNEKKRQDIIAKRSEAGKKGNAVRWGKKTDNQEDIINRNCDTCDNEDRKSSQTVANVAIINIKNKDKDLNKDKASSLRSDASSDKMSDAAEQLLDIAKFVVFFNSEMDAANALIPRLRSLDGQRRSHLLARCREHGKDAVARMVRKAATSDFLNGKSDRGWVANFDWLIRPNNFPKVLEGNYDNNTATQITINDHNATDDITTPQGRAADALRVIARLKAKEGSDPEPLW